MSSYLSAAEAAKRLGVARATLYSYVSRGLVRSRARPGRRDRQYLREDIEQLLERARGRRDPRVATARALGVEGLPVLTSALTSIQEGCLYYRGRDALELSARESFEAVAGLLWGGPCDLGASLETRSRSSAPFAGRHFAGACQRHLADAETRDASAYLTTPEAVRRSGARILAGLCRVATGTQPTARIAPCLARAWGVGRSGERAIEAALVLCADHELNVSAFAARVIASAGATPYMAVSGALGALTGHRHGGLTERVSALLDEKGDPERIIADRLRLGDSVPGFGHPLYPEGDPRAARLLELAPRNAARARCLAVAEAAAHLLGTRPVLDFGLVTLARALALPPSAPFMLFAIGRSAGWIAHCIEQYETGQLIRPRAEYVGPPPGSLQQIRSTLAAP